MNIIWIKIIDEHEFTLESVGLHTSVNQFTCAFAATVGSLRCLLNFAARARCRASVAQKRFNLGDAGLLVLCMLECVVVSLATGTLLKG